jgi:iron complex transport system substrate-binding protein
VFKGRIRAGLFAALTAAVLVGASCSRSAEQAVSKSGEGGAKVERIISAAPSNTEIIAGLGMGDRLIAVDKYSRGIAGVPPGLPEIDFFYPDTEAIIGLEPGLILVNEINSYGVADNPFKMLGDMGINVVQVPTSVSIEGICGDILFIAETLGVKERGEEMVRSLREEIDRIAGAAQNLPKKSVYFEVGAAPTMVSFGQGAYLNEMIDLAGGRNIFAEMKGWFSPSAEEIIRRNPEVIFTLSGGGDPASEIKKRPGFASISAVQENRIYGIDENSAARPSQHILTALREIAAALGSLSTGSE